MPSAEIQDLILRELYVLSNGLDDGHIWVSLYLLKKTAEELRHIDDLKLKECLQALYDKGFINMVGVPLKQGSLFSPAPKGIEYIEQRSNSMQN